MKEKQNSTGYLIEEVGLTDFQYFYNEKGFTNYRKVLDKSSGENQLFNLKHETHKNYKFTSSTKHINFPTEVVIRVSDDVYLVVNSTTRDRYLLTKYFSKQDVINNITYACSIYSKNYISSEKEDDIINEYLTRVVVTENTLSKISLITQQPYGLDTVKVELDRPSLDININYGSGFKKRHEELLKDLKSNNSTGLYLFHGTAGTGKSTYIRWLTSLLNKPVLYLPSNLSSALADPSFVEFVIENKNSIFLIEDAESVLSKREDSYNSAATSNILNLTDGILGEAVKIQVICTFNTDYENLDDALKRKGRLKFRHHFDKLSIEDSQVIVNSLGKSHTVTEEMTLSDIYNLEKADEGFNDKSSKQTKIGF